MQQLQAMGGDGSKSSSLAGGTLDRESALPAATRPSGWSKLRSAVLTVGRFKSAVMTRDDRILPTPKVKLQLNLTSGLVNIS